MKTLFKSKTRYLLLTLSLLCFSFFAQEASAVMFAPGQTFHHTYYLYNGSNCDVTINRITKSWDVTNNALVRMEFPGANPYTSTAQTGSHSYSLSYVLHPGETIYSHLNFYTDSSVLSAQASSDIVWGLAERLCGGSNLVTYQLQNNIIGYCGNGVMEPGESCDDGNLINGDGCSATCTTEGSSSSSSSGGPVCGNGSLEPGEGCDDENLVSGDGCSATCTTEGGGSSSSSGGPSCGNGSLEPGEGCDDGNKVSGDGCSSTCGIEGGSSSSSGGSSSSSGGSSSSSSSSSSSGGGGGCEFDLECHAGDFGGTCDGAPTLQIDSAGMVTLPLTTSSTGDCFDENKVCLKVADQPIVADWSYDIRNTLWSDCLPTTDYEIIGKNVKIAAQEKGFYKARIGLKSSTLFSETCYFDTRVKPIDIRGTTRSQSLGCSADNKDTGDSFYPEARSLMNPRIAQMLQPFYEKHFCQSVRCANGTMVELCGCDATGLGVTLTSLDALDPTLRYTDHQNKKTPLLSNCAIGDVVFFDPVSGGSVTLDAPGDTFYLPDYPITLIVRGADLRIADNLKYRDGTKASLGVILLQNDVCGVVYGGDAFINPDPTNLVGAYYLEGSVYSTDINWKVPNNRNDTIWYRTFRNQLLWEGTIISHNTIGGAVDPNWPLFGTSRCPSSITDKFVACAWGEAVKKDLAYLREYYFCGNTTAALSNYTSASWKIPNCDTLNEIVYDELPGEETAVGSNSKSAVVIKYDGRINSNPPPGFEVLSSIFHSEIGL